VEAYLKQCTTKGEKLLLFIEAVAIYQFLVVLILFSFFFLDDYEAMFEKQEQLRKESRPSQPSFHAENPRSSAIKASNTWASLKKRKNNTKGGGAAMKPTDNVDSNEALMDRSQGNFNPVSIPLLKLLL